MGSNPHEFRLMLGTDKCCASCSRVPISKLWTLGLEPKYLLLGWLGLNTRSVNVTVLYIFLNFCKRKEWKKTVLGILGSHPAMFTDLVNNETVHSGGVGWHFRQKTAGCDVSPSPSKCFVKDHKLKIQIA